MCAVSQRYYYYRRTTVEPRAQKKSTVPPLLPPPFYIADRGHQFDSTPLTPEARKKQITLHSSFPPPDSDSPPRPDRRLHPEIEEEGLEPFQHFRANKHNEICVRGRTGVVNRRLVGAGRFVVGIFFFLFFIHLQNYCCCTFRIYKNTPYDTRYLFLAAERSTHVFLLIPSTTVCGAGARSSQTGSFQSIRSSTLSRAISCTLKLWCLGVVLVRAYAVNTSKYLCLRVVDRKPRFTSLLCYSIPPYLTIFHQKLSIQSKGGIFEFHDG